MKLSAMLIKIMEPWIDVIPIEQLADYASLAWNAAVDGEDAWESINFLHGAQREAIHDNEIKDIIRQIKSRKVKLFPNDFRSVVRMQVVIEEDGEPRVIVASKLKRENMVKMLSHAARNLR